MVIESLLHREVSTRLATLLINLAEGFGEDRAGTIIGVRLTHQDLADMIASVGEAVSKAMSEFQRDGVIETRKRKCSSSTGRPSPSTLPAPLARSRTSGYGSRQPARS